MSLPTVICMSAGELPSPFNCVFPPCVMMKLKSWCYRFVLCAPPDMLKSKRGAFRLALCICPRRSGSNGELLLLSRRPLRRCSRWSVSIGERLRLRLSLCVCLCAHGGSMSTGEISCPPLCACLPTVGRREKSCPSHSFCVCPRSSG